MNLIVNGGFETGAFAAWTVDASAPAPFVAASGSGYPVHTGSFSAHVGSLPGGETPGDSAIYQTIIVPAGGGTLSYWYWPRTIDSITFDWQDAYVTDTSGTVLATIMHPATTPRPGPTSPSTWPPMPGRPCASSSSATATTPATPPICSWTT